MDSPLVLAGLPTSGVLEKQWPVVAWTEPANHGNDTDDKYHYLYTYHTQASDSMCHMFSQIQINTKHRSWSSFTDDKIRAQDHTASKEQIWASNLGLQEYKIPALD